MLEILGYIAAFFMGLTLGTIGGGGSILTVPILVYLMGINPVIATGYSLLIVGSAAAFGALQYYRKGLIHIKAAMTFAIPSIIATYLTRAFVMPAIPDPISQTPITIYKDIALMVLFAGLMIAAAIMMLRNSKKLVPPKEQANRHTGLIIIDGTIVGAATGMLGAGGGFLIIPALVLLIGMPMKEAVGASLLIIALKSLIGFIGDIQSGIELQLPMLSLFFTATFAGMFLATRISSLFDSKKLQQVFAYFILIIAFIILAKELL